MAKVSCDELRIVNVSLDTQAVDQAVHQIEETTNRGRIVERAVIPSGGENCLCISWDHAAWEKRKLLYEREHRAQTCTDLGQLVIGQ